MNRVMCIKKIPPRMTGFLSKTFVDDGPQVGRCCGKLRKACNFIFTEVATSLVFSTKD